MITLEELFGVADIDDITEEEDGTELVFTMRDRRGDPDACFRVLGENLADCLDQASREVNRHRVMVGLRREGLTDDDIERLADADAAWERGYIAGATESADFITEAAFRAPAQSAPVSLAAGEPTLVTVPDLSGEVSLRGKEIPVTLALLMPGRIVID